MLSVVRCELTRVQGLNHIDLLCNTLMIDAIYIADAHPPLVSTGLPALTARFMQDSRVLYRSVQQYMCVPLSTMGQVQHCI